MQRWLELEQKGLLQQHQSEKKTQIVTRKEGAANLSSSKAPRVQLPSFFCPIVAICNHSRSLSAQ